MSIAAKPKLLVTRPQPGADKTAKGLSDLGMESLVLPFTEMVKLEHSFSDLDFSQIDAIVVTSANALRYADRNLLDAIDSVPVYAVGDATKEAALAAGLQQVISANGDARRLIELVLDKVQPGAKLTYLCGKVRTDEIEMHLSKSGFSLRVIETYETKKVSQLTYKLNHVYKFHSVNGILLYSSISAQIYSEVRQISEPEKKQVIPISFCISERAKKSLSSDLQKLSIVCAEPRDDVMLQTVDEYFRTKKSFL